MGLMEAPRVDPGQMIVTPHPLLLDGQRNVIWEARAGESLYTLLMRNVPELDGQAWAVSIGGVHVQRHLWHHVRPKQGQIIEVRGGLGRSALMIVAMAVLSYFTMGAGAGWIAGAFNVAAGGMAAVAIGAGMFLAGSMLINKVLGPKPAKAGNQQDDSVYSIAGARNQLRQYEPLPLLFGRMRITPDLLSKPYTWYEGNDQYLGLLLCAGVNVGRVEAFYNGDTELSNFEGVQLYHTGYSRMADQSIPLYSNADTIDGAKLTDDKAWVERTTSADTVRIQINLEYILGGTGTSGKSYNVSETVEAQYRLAGTSAWQPLVSQSFRSARFDVRRATLAKDVAKGQYDVRVRMLGYGNYSGKNTQKNDFQWTTLTSVQVDEADYTGLSRTGVRIKATDQLNGSPDELRTVGYADPIPVWDGAGWSTEESSNPGAQILAYARGIVRNGRLLGGMALSDEQIDIASLKAFSLHCAANGFTYDHYVKNARSHEQVLSAIALAGFGQITWAGGRLGVVWAAQDQPLSGTVNMGVIKKGQFQVDYNLSNAADGIEYTYLDATTWETKTLRVPAPGVTTMLNPAQVTGEGISSERHAACMARWHLAQSLYQYKDIGYSTDIEHLSYQRLSLLAMQHDMTQWGFGGRLSAALNDAGIVTLTLDEAVPAPANGSAYIGLRIPGERICRVLKVAPFVGESREIVLAEPWPDDAALPGSTPGNPAHDTLWIYDFKQTPGQRVRVVSIQPESDLKGASVRVVLEGPEFWVFVMTGEYIPPPKGSLLPTRPVASNLRVTEHQVVQGDTVFTELSVAFDVTGPVDEVLVMSDMDGNGELEQVASTRTRTATWRIPGAGEYAIVVRPYSPGGKAGEAASVSYSTVLAGAAPVLIDNLHISEQPGGVRRYSWGFNVDTMKSPDFAGVQIRYIQGDVPTPNWADMVPLGGDEGFHVAAFDAVLPVAGNWTFAARSVNTSGDLSLSMLTVQKVLAKNLGEQSVEVVQQLTRHEQSLLEAVDDIDQNALSIVKQAAAQYDLQNVARTHRAYISEIQETKVDAQGARAISQEIVSASVGDMRAAIQETKEAVARMDGRLEATWSVKAQVAENGRYYLAGISAGVYVDGATVQSEVLIKADTFAMLSDDEFGNVYRPFIVDHGVVYLNDASIRNGSISNAKIGDFIQSANFVWDTASGSYGGWRLNKDGSALFAGDVTIRGTVVADSITGLFQRRQTWSWEGTILPASGGVTPTFVLDAPVRTGDNHAPQLLIELTMENGADHSRDGVVTVEAYSGTEWQAVRQKTFLMSASSTVTHFMIVQDGPAQEARQYRIRISRGGSRWGSWTFKGAYVTMQGVR